MNISIKRVKEKFQGILKQPITLKNVIYTIT